VVKGIEVLRLFERNLPARAPDEARANDVPLMPGVQCVVRFPDSTETRWFDKPPSPGTRILSNGGGGYWARVWVVDEVLQSGRDGYTVFCAGRKEYLDNRRRSDGRLDLADELLELARHAHATVSDVRRRRKYRKYLP
jgi:hypothetical protein